jgi:hypothetical protein
MLVASSHSSCVATPVPSFVQGVLQDIVATLTLLKCAIQLVNGGKYPNVVLRSGVNGDK